MKIPEAIEIHTATYGCYFATSHLNEPCSVFTLVSNRKDFENDVTTFILNYVTWQDTDINILLIDLNEQFQVYETTSLKVMINLIEHDCLSPTSDKQMDYSASEKEGETERIFNFRRFIDYLSQSGQLDFAHQEDHPKINEEKKW